MPEPATHNLTVYNDNTTIMCTDHFQVLRSWIWCSCVCFFLGIPACLVGLQDLCRRHRQDTGNDVFMLHLQSADLIFTATLPFAIYNELFLRNMNIVHLVKFIYCLPMCGRPLLMACICGDCYFAVLHPITYRISKNASLVRQAIALIVWCTTFIFGALLVVVKSMYTSCSIALPLTIALPVIAFCDVSVLYALQMPDPSGKKKMHQRKRQALNTIVASLVMTFISYLPPGIIFLLADMLPISKDLFFCRFTFIGISFYDVGCVTMPLLYLNSVRKLDDFKLWLRNKYNRVKGVFM